MGDSSQGESTPFLSSDDEGDHYEGKNMALFEVRQKHIFPVIQIK